MPAFSLSSRTVLVTGATSGIGYEPARQLAERGPTALAHFPLARLLEPALTMGSPLSERCRELGEEPGGRVVNVSSSLHRTASIQWNDPQRARRAHDDRDQRVAPAPAATEDRTVNRLSKLANQLVGHHA